MRHLEGGMPLCTADRDGAVCRRPAMAKDELGAPVCEEHALLLVAAKMLAEGEREARLLRILDDASRDVPGFVPAVVADTWRRRFWWAVAVMVVGGLLLILVLLSK